MRATVQRTAAGDADPYGNPGVPDWQTHIEELPCYVWFEVERHAIDTTKTAAVEDRKAIVPKGTDIEPGDRIVDVRDRLDAVIFTGPAVVDSAGARKDHIALALKEVS